MLHVIALLVHDEKILQFEWNGRIFLVNKMHIFGRLINNHSQQSDSIL